MPRFYFHLHHDAREIPDLDGSECADAGIARMRALETVLEMLAEDLRRGQIDLGWWLTVEDKAGQEIERLGFGKVLESAVTLSQPDPMPRP